MGTSLTMTRISSSNQITGGLRKLTVMTRMSWNMLSKVICKSLLKCFRPIWNSTSPGIALYCCPKKQTMNKIFKSKSNTPRKTKKSSSPSVRHSTSTWMVTYAGAPSKSSTQSYKSLSSPLLSKSRKTLTTLRSILWITPIMSSSYPLAKKKPLDIMVWP